MSGSLEVAVLDVNETLSDLSPLCTRHGADLTAVAEALLRRRPGIIDP